MPSPKLTFRVHDDIHAELLRRARAAGTSPAIVARQLLGEYLLQTSTQWVTLLQDMNGSLEALRGAVDRLAGDSGRDDLGARIDRVYAAVARTHKAIEEADQGTVVERLTPWLVRAVVFLDGLANLSLPDTDQYRQFHKKVEATTHQILAKLTEKNEAQR